jgi:hypothetical protein
VIEPVAPNTHTTSLRGQTIAHKVYQLALDFANADGNRGRILAGVTSHQGVLL